MNDKSTDSLTISDAIEAANRLVGLCHCVANKSGWWRDLQTGEPLQFDYNQQLKDWINHDKPVNPLRNIGELLCLIHSEISEAMEGARKGLMDDKLPRRSMLEVELADAAIRIFDMAGGLKLDLAGAIAEKLAYNAQRADHKIENRAAPGGKTF